MPILKGFLCTWLVYWVLQLVLPISPSGDSVAGALLVQLTLVLGVTMAFVVTDHCCSGLSRQDGGWQPDARLIYIALVLSLVGTVGLVYDKVLVQGIDYSAGLAYAREQWRQLGEARDGAVSSFASALGYLLSASYTVAVVLFPWVRLRSHIKFAVGGAAVMLALVNTLLTGGRSTLLLALLFYLVSRSLAGMKYGARSANFHSRLLLMVMVALSGCYFLYVFMERAEATGISIAEYSHGVIVYLGLQPSDWLSNLRPDSVMTGIIYLIVMGAAYFCHSFATTVSIVDLGPYHNSAIVVFGAVLGIASKLKLMAPVDTDWFLAGLFPSLPGALYLQGGWVLLSAAAVIAGLLGGITYRWFRTWPSLLSLGALTAFGCILLASPILFAGDVLMFPFIVPQFVIVWVISVFMGVGRKREAKPATTPMA